MSFLLAALSRCVMHRDRNRREHLYELGQRFGSLMRHLRGLAIEVALVSRGVMSPTCRGTLITATRGA